MKKMILKALLLTPILLINTNGLAINRVHVPVAIELENRLANTVENTIELAKFQLDLLVTEMARLGTSDLFFNLLNRMYRQNIRLEKQHRHQAVQNDTAPVSLSSIHNVHVLVTGLMSELLSTLKQLNIIIKNEDTWQILLTSLFNYVDITISIYIFSHPEISKKINLEADLESNEPFKNIKKHLKTNQNKVVEKLIDDLFSVNNPQILRGYKGIIKINRERGA